MLCIGAAQVYIDRLHKQKGEQTHFRFLVQKLKTKLIRLF